MIILNLFLFMTFVQNQDVTMPEIVRYITEAIANDCFMGLGHIVLGPNGVNLFMSFSLLDINILSF